MSVEAAALKYRMPSSTFYRAIKRGKLKCSMEFIPRIRLRPSDVRKYVQSIPEKHRARGYAGAAGLKARKLTMAAIPRGRKLVRHGGPPIRRPDGTNAGKIRDNPDKRDERVLSDIDRVP